jgi:multimeric flavodoxin WrbA
LDDDRLMPSSLLILTSSPRRNGNSNTLAEQVAAGARQAGVSVQLVNLADLTIHPCSACDACQTYAEIHCDQDDDMQPIYPALLAADAIVLASPIYCFSFCAQLKLFLDRLYVFSGKVPAPLKGKPVAMLLTYGDTDVEASGVNNAIKSLQDEFAYLEAPVTDIIHASADKPGDIRANVEVMAQAFNLGEKLARNLNSESK